MIKGTGNGTGGRENQLQFLRFLAFLNVFVLHIGSWRMTDYPAWNGAVSAVTFFFLLSGILAGFSVYGREVEVSLPAIARDIWKKLRKVYPLHIVTTCFALIYVGLPAQIVHDLGNSGDALICLLRCMLLVQSWFPDGAMSYNGASWYLSTLFFLYLLQIPMQALLIRIGKKERHKTVFAVLATALMLATAGYSYITYHSGFFSDIHFWQYVFPPARIGQYFIGMVVGYTLRERKEGGIPRKTALFTVAEVLALLVWICALWLPVEVWYNRLLWWIVPNLCLIGVFLLGQGWLSALFRLRPFVRLGDVSFECYLVHGCVINALAGVEPLSGWGRRVCIGIALGYTLLIAFFIHGRSRKVNE